MTDKTLIASCSYESVKLYFNQHIFQPCPASDKCILTTPSWVDIECLSDVTRTEAKIPPLFIWVHPDLGFNAQGRRKTGPHATGLSGQNIQRLISNGQSVLVVIADRVQNPVKSCRTPRGVCWRVAGRVTERHQALRKSQTFWTTRRKVAASQHCPIKFCQFMFCFSSHVHRFHSVACVSVLEFKMTVSL